MLYSTLLDYGFNKIISIVFALLLPISYLTIIFRYFRNYWKREERKKFTVGEKYIVPYSNIDELKEEVKGWLNDNKMNIIREGHDTIEAVRTRVDIGYYDLSIIIKFIPDISKTIIIFDKNLARNYPIINFGIKKVLLELRRNLIRKLNGKEEIKINLTRFFVIDYIFLFVVSLSLTYLIFNKYVLMERLSIIWGSIAIIYPLVRRIWLSHKIQKQANLPEYFIEEYKGDIIIQNSIEQYYPKMVICPNCNKEINYRDNICLYCGMKPKSKKIIDFDFKEINPVILAVPLVILLLIVALNINLDPRRYYNEGVSLYNEGKYNEALQKFDTALFYNSNLEEAWIYKGAILQSQGRKSEALNCFENIIRINPNNAVAWNNKGIIMKDLGNYSEALLCYDKAINLEANYTSAWYNKGLTLHSLGNPSEAISCFDKVIELDATFHEAYYSKALSLYELKRYEEAIQNFEKYLEFVPNDLATKSFVRYSNFKIHYEKGISFYKKEDYDRAILELEQALEYDPTNEDVKNHLVYSWNSKGIEFSDEGDYSNALYCYDKAIELDPAYASAWNNKGVVFDEQRKYDDAIYYFGKAIELQPNKALYWENKGLLLEKQGRHSEAIEYFDKAIVLDPNLAVAWNNKGHALKALGRYTEAQECFDKARELGYK
jgi:tetratricopeptide (TPR) repeat protein